jgi:Mrp family chromosome partitioning ATPase
MSNITGVEHLQKKHDKAVSEASARIEQMDEVDRFTETELDAKKLIYPGTPSKHVLNIFRELRTQLLQLQRKKNFVCMVTSVSHNGGGTYVTQNLASVFALDKTKTSLIVDANLYSPSVQDLIFGEAEAGITDYLSSSHLSIKDVVYATGVPRLRAIPLGTNCEGAAEYFASEKMQGFIEEVKDRYADRYIFIDAPPVSHSSEARILADLVDLVVLVVPHGLVTADKVEAAIDVIGKDKLAGLVYNN